MRQCRQRDKASGPPGRSVPPQPDPVPQLSSNHQLPTFTGRLTVREEPPLLHGRRCLADVSPAAIGHRLRQAAYPLRLRVSIEAGIGASGTRTMVRLNAWRIDIGSPDCVAVLRRHLAAALAELNGAVVATPVVGTPNSQPSVRQPSVSHPSVSQPPASSR